MNEMEYRQQYEEQQRQELRDLQAWEHERDHWIDMAIEEHLFSDWPNKEYIDGILKTYNVDEGKFLEMCQSYIEKSLSATTESEVTDGKA